MMSGLRVIALSVLALACDRPAALPGPDAGTERLELGEPCSDSGECLSGICVGDGESSAVCSRPCIVDGDCPPGDNWTCVAPVERADLSVCGCRSDAEAELCADGRDNDCDGRVDDCLTCGGRLIAGDDDEHCGACFEACAADEECRSGECRCADRAEVLCGGRCVDVMSDADHCGACGSACRSGDVCVGGACACPPERPDRCTDGCFDVASDPDHCGACGNACDAGLECIAGVCACPADRPHRCGNECVETSTDARHCGACGNTCEAGLVCRTGACECTAATVSDFCEGVGCVDFDTDPAHCGGCGAACSDGLVCRDGVCACPVSSAPSYCPGSGCVSLSDDARHCGACGEACSPGLGCLGGVCACPDAGDVHCGGECVDTRWDARHCGGCGMACAVGERCDWGACVCPSGLTCEGVCVSAGPSNCGGCGVTCGVGEVCTGGACVCPVSGQTSCGDGCFDLTRDPMSCGGCGIRCGAGQSCVGGACVCPTGRSWCASLERCVDLSSDEASCGTCGNACPTGTSCSFGTCRCPSSSEQYCAAAGACVDLRTDESHCGACGNACPADATCSSGACVCVDASLRACSGECVDVQIDDDHCGTCGRACGSAQDCRAGACGCFAPTPGPHQRLTTALDDFNTVRAVWNGTHVGLAYTDERAGAWNAYFRLLLEDGTPTGPEVALTSYSIGVSIPTVLSADLAWTGTGWTVVWVEDTFLGGTHVALRSLDASGTPLGPAIMIVPLMPSGERAQSVSGLRVVHSSSLGAVTVATQQRASTYQAVVRVLGDGTAPVPPIALGDASGHPEVAMDGAGRIGVVWTVPMDLSGSFSRPHFRLVEADGSVISGPVVLSGSNTGQVPHIAHDGTEFVVTYLRHSAPLGSPDAEWAIMAARGPAFTPQRLLARQTYPRTVSTPREHLLPRIAARAAEVVVAWQQLEDGEFHIAARRLSPSTLLPIEPASEPMHLPVSDERVPAPLVLTAPNAGVLCWADLRWSQRELYSLGISFPPCP